MNKISLVAWAASDSNVWVDFARSGKVCYTVMVVATVATK